MPWPNPVTVESTISINAADLASPWAMTADQEGTQRTMIPMSVRMIRLHAVTVQMHMRVSSVFVEVQVPLL